jgi:hypothetical protein
MPGSSTRIATQCPLMNNGGGTPKCLALNGVAYPLPFCFLQRVGNSSPRSYGNRGQERVKKLIFLVRTTRLSPPDEGQRQGFAIFGDCFSCIQPTLGPRGPRTKGTDGTFPDFS